MKRKYVSPSTSVTEVIEKYGVMEKENSGVGWGPMGKENSISWDESMENENVSDLWEDSQE